MLPEELVDQILALAQPSLADARSLCLVSYAWVRPVRRVLFAEITVLGHHPTKHHSRSRSNLHDEREVTLYPRFISNHTFAWLVRDAPHLLSFVRVLKISNPATLSFLHELESSDVLFDVQALWLMNVNIPNAIDMRVITRRFSALRTLRLHNVAGPDVHANYETVSEPGLAQEDSSSVSLELVGRIAHPGFLNSIMRASRLQLTHVEYLLGTTDELCSSLGVVQRYAQAITSLFVDVQVFYKDYTFAPDLVTAFRSMLNSCTALVSLKLTNLYGLYIQPVIQIVANTLTDNLRSIHLVNVHCPRLASHVSSSLSYLDSMLAAIIKLQVVTIKLCCPHRPEISCVQSVEKTMPLLLQRATLDVRVSPY